MKEYIFKTEKELNDDESKYVDDWEKFVDEINRLLNKMKKSGKKSLQDNAS